MKSLSLKEQRQALLDHMDASRTGYRHMLADPPPKQRRPAPPPGPAIPEADVVVTTHPAATPVAAARLTDPSHDFPRSMTVRLLMKHPYVSASVAAGVLALIGPKRIGRTLTNPRLISTATAAGGMVLRHQPMMQKYGKMFSMGAGFLQAQRGRKRR